MSGWKTKLTKYDVEVIGKYKNRKSGKHYYINGTNRYWRSGGIGDVYEVRKLNLQKVRDINLRELREKYKLIKKIDYPDYDITN